jgi:hypothetical protein
MNSTTFVAPTSLPAFGHFRPERCVIDPDRMLRLQGYRDLGKVRPAIRKAADAMARRASEVVSPELHYCTIAVNGITKDALLLENGVRFVSGAFQHFFDGAERVVAVIVTLGRGLDQEVIGLIERFEPLEALLIESAGWLAIESTSKAFADRLRRHAIRDGQHATVRMAPGYTYRIKGQEVTWPLEQQREMFNLFSGHELPVQLLSSCAMTPKMSRSGLYGLVPADQKSRRALSEPKTSNRDRDAIPAPDASLAAAASVRP